MRVMVIVDRYEFRGGSSVYLRSLLDTLDPGIRTYWAYGGRSEPWLDLHSVSGIMRRIHNLESGQSGKWDSKVISRLEYMIKNSDPDRLIVQNIMNPAVLSFLSGYPKAVHVIQDHRIFCPARGKVLPDGSPCTVELGEGCAQCFDDQARFIEMYERTRSRLEAAKDFRTVVVLSDYMKKELITAGMDGSRIHVIHPSPKWLGGPRTETGDGIAIPGRITWQKGGHHFLDVLCRSNFAFHTTFVGDGPMRMRLEGRIEATGLEDKVSFTGWIDHEDVPGHLQRFGAVVLPCLWSEPFGLAGLEAAALGIPVVAFDTGGISEWLEPDKTGILIKPLDFKAMIDTIEDLLNNGKKLKALGESAAQAIAERLPLRLLASRWKSILSKN